MNEDSVTGLIIVAVLIIAQAFTTLIYAAITNSRAGQLKELAENGDKRALTVLALNGSTNLTVTFQLVITLIYAAIAGVTVLNVAGPILSADTANPGVMYAAWLFAASVFSVVLGSIVPEAVGSTYAEAVAPMFSGVMKMLMFVLSPVVFVLLYASKLISSIFGGSDLVNTITDEEIMTLVEEGHTGGTIEDEEKNMIYSVLQLDQTRVSEVMIPRIDIVAIDINATPEEAGKAFIESGYSRIPVYEENIDNVKGLLYAKDLMAHWMGEADDHKTIGELMRPAYFVPETKGADELLKEIQSEHVHMAIVLDEYGGTAGLVTIENVIEEIIGDIQDEYDLNEEADYEQHGEDEYTVDASIDLDDFNELLDVDLPTEDSDTLGGYIYSYFGRVPMENETIEGDNLTLHILSIDGRRIRKVHALRKRTTGEIDESEATSDESGTDEEQHIREVG